MRQSRARLRDCPALGAGSHFLLLLGGGGGGQPGSPAAASMVLGAHVVKDSCCLRPNQRAMSRRPHLLQTFAVMMNRTHPVNSPCKVPGLQARLLQTPPSWVPDVLAVGPVSADSHATSTPLSTACSAWAPQTSHSRDPAMSPPLPRAFLVRWDVFETSP